MTTTNADKAYKEILNRIIKSEMAPGSVIEEPELMESLGLGRTPIREALKRLANEKFISVSPRRGMFVENISITDINRIYEIRYELEALCVKLVIKRIRPEQIEQLQGHVAQSADIQLDDIDEVINHDRSFHFMLYSASYNQFLVNDLMRYYNMSLRIWYSGLLSLEPVKVGILHHFKLVEAILNKDEKEADEIIRRHISDFQKNIQNNLI